MGDLAVGHQEQARHLPLNQGHHLGMAAWIDQQAVVVQLEPLVVQGAVVQVVPQARVSKVHF